MQTHELDGFQLAYLAILLLLLLVVLLLCCRCLFCVLLNPLLLSSANVLLSVDRAFFICNFLDYVTLTAVECFLIALIFFVTHIQHIHDRHHCGCLHRRATAAAAAATAVFVVFSRLYLI